MARVPVLRRVVRLRHLRRCTDSVLAHRVLEYLNGLKGRLPPTVSPTLGPDATRPGSIYQYALEATTGKSSLADLCSLQDWSLRYQLTSVPGVSEVATIGGFEKQYQVDLDPAKLLAYRIPVTRVMQAIQNANADIGAMVMELSERERFGPWYERSTSRHATPPAPSCAAAGDAAAATGSPNSTGGAMPSAPSSSCALDRTRSPPSNA